MNISEHRCKCKNNQFYREEKYSLWGFFLLSVIGITPKAKENILKCSNCNAIIKREKIHSV